MAFVEWAAHLFFDAVAVWFFVVGVVGALRVLLGELRPRAEDEIIPEQQPYVFMAALCIAIAIFFYGFGHPLR